MHNTMLASVKINDTEYKCDFSKPLDISIPLVTGNENVNAWYCDPVKIEPVRMGEWVGDVKQGGSVNFRNVMLNPHGNGTHTECVGHISSEDYTINQCLQKFFFLAEVVSVVPRKHQDDFVITRGQLMEAVQFDDVSALIVRTLPNTSDKLTHHYSNTNPPYFLEEAALWMVTRNIQHLLTDLPSVDRERDEGKLLAHHAFWKYPEATRKNATISELIYVPDTIPDGKYLLNLQITSLENDASPSKPVLYRIL